MEEHIRQRLSQAMENRVFSIYIPISTTIGQIKRDNFATELQNQQIVNFVAGGQRQIDTYKISDYPFLRKGGQIIVAISSKYTNESPRNTQNTNSHPSHIFGGIYNTQPSLWYTSLQQRMYTLIPAISHALHNTPGDILFMCGVGTLLLTFLSFIYMRPESMGTFSTICITLCTGIYISYLLFRIDAFSSLH